MTDRNNNDVAPLTNGGDITANEYKNNADRSERLSDNGLMQLALAEAKAAFEENEVPVGAVIAKDGIVIAGAHNRRENGKNAAAHAELLCIERACEKLGTWRLSGCTLYVTLEPCPMCAGAVINARLDRVVYALKDAKAGAFGSVMDLNSYPLNHKPKIEYGLYGNESEILLKDFFKKRRLRAD